MLRLAPLHQGRPRRPSGGRAAGSQSPLCPPPQAPLWALSLPLLTGFTREAGPPQCLRPPRPRGLSPGQQAQQPGQKVGCPPCQHPAPERAPQSPGTPQRAAKRAGRALPPPASGSLCRSLGAPQGDIAFFSRALLSFTSWSSWSRDPMHVGSALGPLPNWPVRDEPVALGPDRPRDKAGPRRRPCPWMTTAHSSTGSHSSLSTQRVQDSKLSNLWMFSHLIFPTGLRCGYNPYFRRLGRRVREI